MYTKIYQFFPSFKLLKLRGFSERGAAQNAKISRITWRSVVAGKLSVTLESLKAVADTLEVNIVILASPSTSCRSNCSTVAVSLYVLRDGPASWKIHFMDLVDEFRRTLDPQLLLLPPVTELSLELKGLLAAIVVTLCEEVQESPPPWAAMSYNLPTPWFVSESESLKAIALLESPLPFRKNNIFVTGNFMERA